MNCPSRTEEPIESDGYNQNPNALSNDLTTNQDLNGLANTRELRRTDPPPIASAGTGKEAEGITTNKGDDHPPRDAPTNQTKASGHRNGAVGFFERAKKVLANAGKFVGPGFMIAVAYSWSHSSAVRFQTR